MSVIRMQRDAVVTSSFLWLTVRINYFISENMAHTHIPINVRRFTVLINLTYSQEQFWKAVDEAKENSLNNAN